MPYESQKERRVTITVRPAGMAVLVFIPV